MVDLPGFKGMSFSSEYWGSGFTRRKLRAIWITVVVLAVLGLLPTAIYLFYQVRFCSLFYESLDPFSAVFEGEKKKDGLPLTITDPVYLFTSLRSQRITRQRER